MYFHTAYVIEKRSPKNHIGTQFEHTHKKKKKKKKKKTVAPHVKWHSRELSLYNETVKVMVLQN
jgi:hypothetical protein